MTLHSFPLRVLVIVGVLVLAPLWTRAASPVVSGLIIATTVSGSDLSSVVLTENITTSFLAIGAGSDADGCEQIDATTNWSGAFYRTNVTSGSSCMADDENCYQLSSGDVTLETVPDGSPNTCTGGPDTDLGVYTTANVQFFADPTDAGAAVYSATDWSYYIEADDGTSTGSATDTVEMNTLLALDPGAASINYGSIVLGGSSLQQSLTLQVTGNAALDVDLSVDGDMPCSIRGSVAASKVEYSLSNGFSYGAGTGLAVTSGTVQADLVKPTSATPVTDDLYLVMGLPESGLAGSCSNTMTVTALADS